MGSRHRKRGKGHALGLTHEKVVSAALDMVDREGVEGLRMRALASQIGCDPMAIYHFVPNKAALLDAITEHLEREGAPPGEDVTDWRVALQEFAYKQLAVALRHPNAIPLFTLRVSDNPATTATHKWLQTLFEGLQLPDPLHAMRLYASGINGVLLNYFAIRARTPDAERIAQTLMKDMVSAICSRLSEGAR